MEEKRNRFDSSKKRSKLVEERKPVNDKGQAEEGGPRGIIWMLGGQFADEVGIDADGFWIL